MKENNEKFYGIDACQEALKNALGPTFEAALNDYWDTPDSEAYDVGLTLTELLDDFELFMKCN